MRTPFLVTFGLVVALTPQLAFADYDEARQALDAGQLERARTLFVAPAQEGDARAQYALGRLLLDRRGFSGTAWIQKAAEAGYLPAQARLGRMRLLGLHVPRDPVKAIAWLQNATSHAEEAEHALEASYARYWLAEAYRDGIGVEADALKALELFRLAADAGNERAQYEYAKSLHAGLGAPKDLVEAYKYFALCARQNHVLNPDSAWENVLFSPTDMMRIVQEEMSPQQAAESRRRVGLWLREKDAGSLGRIFEQEARRPKGVRILDANERGWEQLYISLWYFSGAARDGCEEFRVTKMAQTGTPGTEIWTIDRCGTRKRFEISLFVRGPEFSSFGYRVLDEAEAP